MVFFAQVLAVKVEGVLCLVLESQIGASLLSFGGIIQRRDRDWEVFSRSWRWRCLAVRRRLLLHTHETRLPETWLWIDHSSTRGKVFRSSLYLGFTFNGVFFCCKIIWYQIYNTHWTISMKYQLTKKRWKLLWIYYVIDPFLSKVFLERF